MINFLSNYGLFAAEVITIVIAILILLSGIVAMANKGKTKAKEKIEITKLNEKYDEIKEILQSNILSKQELKIQKKQKKIKEKNTKKQAKKDGEPKKQRRRIFVLDFLGDMKASTVENLREEVTSILTIATPKDEVLVKVDSAGGLVHSYGLVASQLKRIRDRDIPLIAAVDKIAASGGYMVACVANRILAAPFAIIGSIGVVTQLPNFNRFLKKHNIDFEQITAGEYKRTLTMFGENTNKGRKKLQEELEEAHELFKTFIATNRSVVNINAISTGEHWYGTHAKELRLVDELVTSDDYLLKASENADIYEITYTIKKSLMERFSLSIQKALAKIGV